MLCVMKWLYYIPHKWEEEKTTWEDIWLQPIVRDVAAESYWLTVSIDDRLEFGYVIEGDEMHVQEPFTKQELLEYAETWIGEHLGVTAVSLIEGDLDEFEGTNDHARSVSIAKKRAEQLIGQSSSDGYDE